MRTTSQLTSEGFGFLGLVLAILLASISSVTIVALVRTSESSRHVQSTVARAKTLREGISNYQRSHGGATTGTYPATLTALVVSDGVPCTLDNTPTNVNTYRTLQGWCGPYSDQAVAENADEYRTDGWGSFFTIAAGVLRSCGPDRTCGNGDDLVFNP